MGIRGGKEMIIPSDKVVKQLRLEYPNGTRIRLIQMDDDQAPPKGTLGTVRGVDDCGSLLVHWDNGSTLNALYKVDIVEKVVTDKKLMRYIPKEYKKLVVQIYEGNRYWDEVKSHWNKELIVEWENGEESTFANKTYAYNVLKEFHDPEEYRKEG